MNFLNLHWKTNTNLQTLRLRISSISQSDFVLKNFNYFLDIHLCRGGKQNKSMKTHDRKYRI